MNPLKPDFAAGFPHYQRVQRGPTTAFGARGPGEVNGAKHGGGSPLVEIWHNGVKEHHQIHFDDPNSRIGCQVTVLPDGDVLVGGGFKGGPRWQRWTRIEDATKTAWNGSEWINIVKWTKLSDQFLGGKVGSAMREGCGFTASGLPMYGYSEVDVTLPVQPFIAQPWPSLPGDTMRTNAILSAVPAKLQARCVREGVRVYVYAGSFITDMREYSSLKDVKTHMDGDGGRTWGQVSAAAFGDKCFVTESGSHTLHEVGHIVTEFMWRSDEASKDFYDLWDANEWNWDTPYERTGMSEAAAECIRRHIERPESNGHLRGVREYMERYLPEATA